MNKPDHFSEVVSEFVDDFVVGVTRMGKLFTRVTLALSAKEKEGEKGEDIHVNSTRESSFKSMVD